MSDPVSETNEQQRIVMRDVSYEIQDNNNYLKILKNGKPTLAGLNIHYSETDGFFFDEDFTDSERDEFSGDLLNSFKEMALAELNV